jgi:two-component system OmpR family sensor kinase
MPRPLTLLALAIIVLGVLAAVVMRLALPTTALAASAVYDPASVLVVAAVLVGVVLLGAGAFVGWQQAQAQRALAAQAAALDAERRRFIQRLDHELKNPLTAIQVQLDNLQADTQAGLAIKDVRSQADRLSTLTRGLRRLADLESRPFELERVEIGELLDEMVDLLQASQRLTLDVQRVPWPIPPIQADRELLLMALRNLADNALKYSAGAVQVRARDLSSALLVEVIDTGRGILPDDLPHVSEELYRGRNAHDVSGSGLGLAMVQRIIARHGGKLEIRSRPGQGTIATLQLPYEQAKSR